jgi:mRNA-degrading endonuclease toxin of MazEF toxin-antitoxin module
VKHGTACWINLEPASPPEMGKTRPGIVVSRSVYNERLESVVVVPLSSRAPDIWPLRLEVDVPGLKRSFAVIPGVRQVSKARVHAVIGEVPRDIMERIGEALTLYLHD